MKHTIKEWLFATRFWSLTASSMPALTAYSYVFYISDTLPVEISWWHGVLAILGAITFQVAGNLLNDYFDFKYNVDRKETTYSSRIIVDGEFTPQSIYKAGVIALIIGCLIGFYLLYAGSVHLLWIGALGVLGTYFYNQLKFRALGDFNILIIYGILIGLGVVYVMTGQLMWQAFAVTTPAGLIIVGILHANNTRDIINDRTARIKTQAMLLGVNNSKSYFTFLIYGAYLGIIVLTAFQIITPFALVVFVTFPMAMKCVERIFLTDINNLSVIRTLTESVAKLVMLFCLLQSAANFVAGLI
ncbi:MAG: prenyltransferase [Culturomica sp.]|jgi:1,4-dihydroxy-2-naphthoate octaprenyltransferase|nr:prenyltransferase [Culturomica sp.]